MPIINREKERQIVEQGLKQGKSQDFIKQAIIRFRETQTQISPEVKASRQQRVQEGASQIRAEERSGLEQVVRGVGKGGISTLKGASSLGEKGIKAVGRFLTPKKFEKTLGFEKTEQTAAERLVPEELTTPETKLEKAGFAGEQIAEFLLPGGAATKIAKATKVGKLGQLAARGSAEAGLFAGQTALQTGGDVKKTAEAGLAGALTPVAFKAVGAGLKLTGRLFGAFTKNVAGAITGKGTDIIEQILKSPKAAKTGLVQPSLKVMRELSEKTLAGVRSISKDASKAYGKALEELPKRLGRNPSVLTAGQKTTIKVAGRNIVLSMKGAKSKLTKELRKFGVEVSPRKKTFGFLESPFVDSEERILKKAFGFIDNWKDTTPKGLNDLAVKLGRLEKKGSQSTQLNSVIGSMKKNVRNYIGDRVPEVKVMNKKFAQEQDFIEAISKELSIKKGFPSTANITNTAKKISTLFNKNKELARSFVEQLEQRQGIKILAPEAGRQIAEPLKAGFNIRSLVSSVIPSKLIGQISVATGLSKQRIQAILNKQSVKNVLEGISKIDTLSPTDRTVVSFILGSQE